MNFRLRQKFLYEYDLKGFWRHKVRLERITEPDKSYPLYQWQAG